MNRKLLRGGMLFLAVLALSPLAVAREKVQGWCEQGNQTVTTSGLTSTSKVQGSFPSCIITVWDVGTMNIASIFSDDVGTVKANPFTASADGLWFFYADNASYDVQLSGGGIATPFTLSDISLDDAAQSVTTVTSVASSPTPNFDASAASIFTNTLTANVTSSTITGGVAGQIITLYLLQDGTGGWTFAFPASVTLRTATFVVSDDASAVSSLTAYFDGANWREIGRTGDEIGRDLLPVTTGRNLGSAGARWDGFLQTLDVVTVDSNLLPASTGQDLGAMGARWDAFLDVTSTGLLNNVRKCDSDKYAGADAGAKTIACIGDLPSTGGVADARGFEGAQTISTTISITKTVKLMLGCATWSGTPDPLIFVDADGGGDGTVIEGSGDCSVLQPNGATNRAIYIQSVTGAVGTREQIILRDLAIRSATSGSSTAGLHLQGLSVFKLENVFIDGLSKMDNCFRMTAAQQGEVSGGKAFGCTTGALLESNAAGTVSSNGLDWHGMSFNNSGTNLLVAATPGVGAQSGDFHDNHLTAAAMQIDISTDIGQFNVTSNHLEPLAGNNGAIVRSGKVAFALNSFFGFPGTKDLEILTGSQVKAIANLFVADILINAGALDTMLAFNNTGGTITDSGTRTRNWMNRAFAGSPLTTSVIFEDFLPGLATLDLGAPGASRWAEVWGIDADFSGLVDFGSNLRRSVANVLVESSGNAYGMEQVTAAQTGTDNALRLFTASGGTAIMVFGRYTDATTFVDFATFDNSGNLKLDGGLSQRDTQTLAASTTPSIAGANVFATNNTANITNFVNGIDGKTIYLLCGADTTTSLVDSTPLFLSGAFTCTANDSIHLLFNGSVWTEINRSVN